MSSFDLPALTQKDLLLFGAGASLLWWFNTKRRNLRAVITSNTTTKDDADDGNVTLGIQPIITSRPTDKRLSNFIHGSRKQEWNGGRHQNMSMTTSYSIMDVDPDSVYHRQPSRGRITDDVMEEFALSQNKQTHDLDKLSGWMTPSRARLRGLLVQ
jgi:hypothetical protein